MLVLVLAKAWGWFRTTAELPESLMSKRVEFHFLTAVTDPNLSISTVVRSVWLHFERGNSNAASWKLTIVKKCECDTMNRNLAPIWSVSLINPSFFFPARRNEETSLETFSLVTEYCLGFYQRSLTTVWLQDSLCLDGFASGGHSPRLNPVVRPAYTLITPDVKTTDTWSKVHLLFLNHPHCAH